MTAALCIVQLVIYMAKIIHDAQLLPSAHIIKHVYVRTNTICEV